MVAFPTNDSSGAGQKLADSGNSMNNVSSYEDVERFLTKKARLDATNQQPASVHIPVHEQLETEPPAAASGILTPNDSDDKVNAQAKSGRWGADEKLMFLYGLSVYGKGRWKKIHAYVPNRSLVQIKSHAQKVLKRMDAGENVFQKLEDCRNRLNVLVREANQRIDEEARLRQSSKKKRKRSSTRKPSLPLPACASPWDIVEGQGNLQKSVNVPCTASSPVPSLMSATEDPPGVHASQHDETILRHATVKNGSTIPSPTDAMHATSLCGVPTGGTGAVIAAVAALCQLSAGSDSLA